MSDLDNINLPVIFNEPGALHPVNQTKDFLLKLLSDIGFEEFHGPEIESEKFNFDMLNIKKSHPARQMHDTFYVNEKANVLRTHTSPVQIRGMLSQKPPLAFISNGKVYRKDDDSTHLPMFHQIEGLVVDEKTHLGHLKWTLETFFKSFFELDNIEIQRVKNWF